MSLSFYGSLYDYSILFQLQSYWGLGLIEDHGVFEIIQILTVELVAMLILLGIYLSPKNRKKDLFIKEFFHYDKIWSIFMLLILVIYQVPLFLNKTNIADHLFRYFEGISPNGFNLLTVFYDMGIVLLPIFFIGVRMEEFQNSYFSTVAIRYREKEDLQKKVFFQNLKNIAVYFIIYSILALILYLFSEGKDFLYYEEFPWKIKIFPLIIGKGFEMLFLYLLFFAILQLTKSRVLSFTLLLVFDVFFVFIPTPIGRMNIYWISELGEQCKILFLMNGLLFILIYYLLKKGVQDGKSHTIKKHQ
ncbi:MAG: hypothetical protein Q4P28_02060 [Tissierellia bacterium]|nr:hypothetical protein [Tissierellia bacterium]